MPNNNLATYLMDHDAGALAGVELLANLEKAYAGTEASRLAAELREEVVADRAVLEALMKRLSVDPSRPRQASVWLGEKLTQLKLRLDDPASGALRLLETTEAISLGVEGKRSLWLALAAASADDPQLRGTDYEALALRAADQRLRLEALRIGAAKDAL